MIRLLCDQLGLQMIISRLQQRLLLIAFDILFLLVLKAFHVKLNNLNDHFQVFGDLLQCLGEIEEVDLGLVVFGLGLLNFLCGSWFLTLFCCLFVHFINVLIVPQTLLLFVLVSDSRTVLKVLFEFRLIDKHSFLIRTFYLVLHIAAMRSTILWSFDRIEFTLPSFSCYPELTCVSTLFYLICFFLVFSVHYLIFGLIIVVVLHECFKQCRN